MKQDILLEYHDNSLLKKQDRYYKITSVYTRISKKRYEDLMQSKMYTTEEEKTCEQFILHQGKKTIKTTLRVANH